MSFISSVKKALGFPGEFDGDEFDEDEELDDDDLLDDPDPVDNDAPVNPDGSIDLSDSQPEKPLVSEDDLKAMSADLFDSVLNYFNSKQPELVQKCIDIEAQRSILLQEMESNLRARLLAMADQACRRGENLWAEKQQKMGAELMKLKSEYNSVRQQREEFQSAQLSATRQKRALTERVHDLESQVTVLEAEREQLQLENKSMAARLRNKPQIEMPTVVDNSELQRLTGENEQLNAKIAELAAELEAAKESVKETQQAAADLTVTESDRDYEEEIREIHEQFQQLKELKEKAEISVYELKKEIAESDATITQLQKQLAESAMKADASMKEIDSLKSTIETNLYAHAEAENELRNEIKRLNALCATIPPLAPSTEKEKSNAGDTQEPSKKPKKSNRKKSRKKHNETPLLIQEEHETSPVKISAIDELMDSTDWFVAPEPEPLKKDPEVEEIFGYKEPPKKQEPENDDRQLTLW